MGGTKKATGAVGRPRKNAKTNHATSLSKMVSKAAKRTMFTRSQSTLRRPVGRPRKLSQTPPSSNSSRSDSSEEETSDEESLDEESSDEETSDEESSDDDCTPRTEKIKVNKKEVKLTFVKFTVKDDYAHARKMERLRRKKAQKKQNGPVKLTDSEISKLANKSMGRTLEMYTYIKLDEEDQDKKLIEKQLASLRHKKVPDDIQERIEKLIYRGVKIQVMRAQEKRKYIKVDSIKMYINENQFGAKITEKALFNFTDVNVVSKSNADKKLQRDYNRIGQMEAKQTLCCSCVDKCEPSSCLCRGFQSVFQKQKKPNNRRFYTCSPMCACKGKCSSSLIDFPEQGTEVMMHPETQKGFAVRSKQYFGQGDIVSEMTGVLTDTANLQSLDDYSIDMTSEDNDAQVLNEILDNKKNTKLVRAAIKNYPASYKMKLKQVMKGNYSINPKDLSTYGRFISSSCFANVTPCVVFSNGISPLNVRCMFRATAPIFPNQEIAFTYSDEYIFQQLKDVCTCGSLCCVRNRDLYPYLRKSHFQKFYTLLYTELYKDYKKNVIDPVDSKIKIKERLRKIRDASVSSTPAKKRRISS